MYFSPGCGGHYSSWWRRSRCICAKRENRLLDEQPIVTFNLNGEMVVNGSPDDVAFLHECRDGEDGLELFAKFFLNTTRKTKKGKKVEGSFTKPFTKARKEFSRRLSDPSIPYNWAMAHRGMGKTTLLWAEMIRRLCFRLSPFVLYCSSEIHLAERRTEAIKKALISTPRIIQYFGKMNPVYMDGMREVFGTHAWKLADPITGLPYAIVVPKSDGTTVNGLVEFVNGRQTRPTYIVCDDMTDRLRVHDETYRSQHKSWFFGTLLPCVDNEEQPDPKTHRWPGLKRGEIPPWQVCVIDTYKHGDALIETLAQDADWIGGRYPLAEETEPGSGIFRSMVENMTDAQVQSMFDRARRLGSEDEFFREQVCRAGFSNDNTFPTTHQYYNDTQAGLNTNPLAVRFLVMDPARTRNSKSAYTAILAVAVDCVHAKVWLRRLSHERMSQEDMALRLWEMSRELETDIICVEDAGLNDHIRGPLERYFTSKGRYVEWMWLPTQRKFIEAEGERRSIKEARASSALWLYRPMEPNHPKGHVWHDESLRNSPLEQQQKSYPDCKRWDAMDTLGHVDYVMRELGLTFDEQAMASKDQTDKNSYDEWDELLTRRSWAYEQYVGASA